MLVLARKVAEELRIGDDVSVTVLRTQGNTVLLGITAPRSVPIRRSELHPACAPDQQPTSMTFTELAAHVGQASLSSG